jgi:hypothetical protein
MFWRAQIEYGYSGYEGEYYVMQGGDRLAKPIEFEIEERNNYLYAQQDVDGTRRIIRRNGVAQDPVTFDTLWTVSPPQQNQPVFCMRIDESLNERILLPIRSGPAYHYRYRIHDAATGDSLGTTAQLAGSPQYVLKRESNYDLLVTYRESTIRLYRSARTYPLDLTIEYLPSSNLLYLHWEDVSDADGYTVRRYQQPPPGIPVYVTTVSTNRYWLALPDDGAGFFTVEANY